MLSFTVWLQQAMVIRGAALAVSFPRRPWFCLENKPMPPTSRCIIPTLVLAVCNKANTCGVVMRKTAGKQHIFIREEGGRGRPAASCSEEMGSEGMRQERTAKKAMKIRYRWLNFCWGQCTFRSSSKRDVFLSSPTFSLFNVIIYQWFLI